MGTFATLTGVSGNTAEVHTQLAAISCYHMQAVECSHQVGHGHEKAGHNIHQCRFCGQEGALGLEMLALAGRKASKAAVALKISLRGLLTATGIGLAFVAMTSIVEYPPTSLGKTTICMPQVSELLCNFASMRSVGISASELTDTSNLQHGYGTIHQEYQRQHMPQYRGE